jgi:hypothetical protein
MAALLECRVDVGARNARSPFNCGARTDHGAGISIFNFDQAYGFPFTVQQTMSKEVRTAALMKHLSIAGVP